ncbi:unnamed protein product [Ceratitis capitata]|uniref:(Mediterranean fruit fly) hypothetical protein n=1 Tax=Ceratitis capitata TaxID=7213 RepID=A0A811UVU8_CERCA|nr:unnamed protein product [Ceratitis capitata]
MLMPHRHLNVKLSARQLSHRHLITIYQHLIQFHLTLSATTAAAAAAVAAATDGGAGAVGGADGGGKVISIQTFSLLSTHHQFALDVKAALLIVSTFIHTHTHTNTNTHL